MDAAGHHHQPAGPAAVRRRRLPQGLPAAGSTAVAHPHSGVAAPSGQQDEQSARQLREVIAAAWAAIDAAPSPGPAQLEQARRTYRDTSPVQETLFTGTEPAQQHDDASRTAGQAAAGARPSPQAPGLGAPPADSTDTPAAAEATAVSAPTAPARQRHADAPTRPRPPRAARHGRRSTRPRRHPRHSPARRSPTTTSASACAGSPRWCSRSCSASPAQAGLWTRRPASWHRTPVSGQPASPTAEPGKRSPRRRRACASRSTPRTAPAPGCSPGPRSPAGCSPA